MEPPWPTNQSKDSPIDKQDVVAMEHIEQGDEPGIELTKSQERRMWAKIDIKVVTMMAIVLGISVIDRINIGSAKVLGMQEDLNIDAGSRYSVALLVFFPGYFISEIPSNMMLVKVGVKIWMTILTVGFGICVLCMGFSPNHHVLSFLRFMLGIFEGGIYPACVFLISSWYPKYKLHRRLSALYGIATIGSTFAGLLAYGIGQLSGRHGYLGWRWIFIIEGAATIGIGCLTYYFVSEFPDKAKFLKEDEKRHLFAILDKDNGGNTTERLTWARLKTHAKDPFVWVSTLMFMCIVIPTYGLGFFMPSILVLMVEPQGLGHSGLQATLHSAPPYAASIGMLILTAFIGDKLRMRAPIIISLALLTLIGMILVSIERFERLVTDKAKVVRPVYSSEVRYAGLFFAVMGAQANQTAILSFAQNNIVGSSKKLFVSALNIGGGALGGIIGSTIFRSEDAPTYGPGLYTVIALQALLICLTTVYTTMFWIVNRRADASTSSIINGIDGWRHTL
ncbi:unnamed protein product [Clonostachys rosea]|uniref:Major facilitator superfamily (MFS) profile domain-containing protein n=1 Tax=Bionectria ochroleuca TaxID=29856 RepID=A0ABY6V1Z4_BIOOC|nr:unnamed protein product [Clonostachys rosea]